MSNLENKKSYGLFANSSNTKLIAKLKQDGEKVLIFPSIETESVELTETGANHLRNLTDFDWIILTDIFAADYFIESLRKLAVDFFELDNLTVCAIGEAVADRLRFVQLHADVIPSNINDESVFSAISQFVGGDLDDLRFLALSEISANFGFLQKLTEESAFVENLPIYRAKFADESANVRFKTLLKSGAVDEFIFSSPEDLAGLKFLASEADLTKVLNEINVSAVSEIVYQTLQENGFRPLYFHHK